jgi:hypothetical protein
VDVYIHSPIRLHGVVLNYLSTGTTLPYNPHYLEALKQNIREAIGEASIDITLKPCFVNIEQTKVLRLSIVSTVFDT